MNSATTPLHHRQARAEALISFEGVTLGRDLQAEFDATDVLQTARVAGVMAARRAPQLLPYAAAAEVTEAQVDTEWADDGLHISAFIEGFSRDELGSRALLAANVCATTIVDMLRVRPTSVIIEQARIVEQKGGLDALEYDFDPPVDVGILVISDAVAGGHKDDRAGSLVRGEVDGLSAHGVEAARYEVVGDDAEAIEQCVRQMVDDGVEVVLTVGGTGLSHTDTTVETVAPMLDRPVPGIMEAARAHGQQLTPLAFMSRGVAGLIGDTLVVTLPGSSAGARESCEALFPALLHVVKTLRKSKDVLG